MRKVISIGKVYGKLIVVDVAGSNDRKQRLWLCECNCGNTVVATSSKLNAGDIKSCGCLITGPDREDLVGKRFSRLIVESFSHKDKWRTSWWNCKCDCQIVTTKSRSNLITGRVKSCGCLKRETDASRIGIANPSYNPNLSTEDRIPRRDIFGYKEWRNEVKKRDNFICQICHGKDINGNPTSHTLNSHHIDGYDLYPDKRLDIDNGICLCETCHVNFHKQYGRGKNTRTQFEEYRNEYARSKSS